MCDLDSVLTYENNAVVSRLQKKLKLDEGSALELFQDTKRFLYLAAVTGKAISPTPIIDDGWHEFLLFTEDYAEFCQRYFGRFLHHRPTRPGDPPSRVNTLEEARRTLGENLSSNWIGSSDDCTPEQPCETEPSDCAITQCLPRDVI